MYTNGTLLIKSNSFQLSNWHTERNATLEQFEKSFRIFSAILKQHFHGNFSKEQLLDLRSNEKRFFRVVRTAQMIKSYLFALAALSSTKNGNYGEYGFIELKCSPDTMQCGVFQMNGWAGEISFWYTIVWALHLYSCLFVWSFVTIYYWK